MSHLSDMEELLQKIPNSSIADYMKEALQCYSVGAYRGCIVLSCIALFDDSVNKLADIRTLNKKAREIHDEVVRRQKTQDVYESYLLDQLTANKLISELDSSTAEVIKNRRNKSAHASGHQPSAEEARFIYFEVIDKFLSKPSLSSKVLADEILERLSNKSFFPSNNINDIKSVVEHELKLLHKDAFPYLIAKLTDFIKSSDNNLSANSSYLLCGISSLNDSDWNVLLIDKLFEKKLDDDDYTPHCLSLISVNPSLLSVLSLTSLERLKSAINKNTNDTPNSSSVNSPAQLFENILRKQPLLLELLENECIIFLSKHSYLSISPKIAISTPKLWSKYQELLIQKSGSGNFDTANNFVSSFGIIESEVVENSENHFLFKLALAIARAAQFGAWGSESIVSNKFEKFSKLKEALIEFMNSNESDAKKELEIMLPSCDSISAFIKKYIDSE